MNVSFTLNPVTVANLDRQAKKRGTNASALVNEILDESLDLHKTMHRACAAIFDFLPHCVECGAVAPNYGFTEADHARIDVCNAHVGRLAVYSTTTDMQVLLDLFATYAPEFLVRNPLPAAAAATTTEEGRQ